MLTSQGERAAVSARQHPGRLPTVEDGDGWPPWRLHVQAFTEEQRAELHAVEAQVRRRIAIGSTVSERKLKDELVRVGMSEMLIGRCLHYLQQQGDVELVCGRRMIHRIR